MAIERGKKLFYKLLDNLKGGAFPALPEIPGMSELNMVWKPRDLQDQFSLTLLDSLGANNIQYLGHYVMSDFFREKFNANLFDVVFPADGSASPIDDKRHGINMDTINHLKNAFPHKIGENLSPTTQQRMEIRLTFLPSNPNVFPDWERAIDLETKYILTTMIIPTLRKSGKASLFVEDFMSAIDSKPGRQNMPAYRYLPFADNELKEAVAWRIDRLKAELGRISTPIQPS